MTRSRLLPALLAAPLCLALVPRPAHACAPAVDFILERTYPAADAIDVPRDASLILLGQGSPDAWVTVEVTQDDQPIEGTLHSLDGGQYRWSPGELLVAGDVYDVHIEVNPAMDPPAAVHDFSFTAGPTVAPEPEAPTITKFAVERYEQELKECVVAADPGSCKDCEEWKVIGVEERLRLMVDVEHPVGGYGDFDGFRGSHVDYSADLIAVSGLGDDADQGPEAGPTHHIIDLGPAEWAWPNVCVSVNGFDPAFTYILLPHPPSCISTAVEEDTDSDFSASDGDDTAPTTAGEDGEGGSSSGDSSDGPEMDGDAGCGCRSTHAPNGSLLLMMLALGLARPRRRGSAP